jgi:Periplasmic binding protein domain
MSNKTLTVLIGAAAIVGSSAAPRADEPYIPLISKGFQHQFWQAAKLGAEQTAKKLNVKITFEAPETEAMVDKQIDMLAADLAKHPNAIGFAALDSKAAIPCRRHKPNISPLSPSTPASTAISRLRLAPRTTSLPRERPPTSSPHSSAIRETSRLSSTTRPAVRALTGAMAS